MASCPKNIAIGNDYEDTLFKKKKTSQDGLQCNY